MNYTQKLVTAIELHSVEGIRESFEHGINPNDMFNGQPLIYELTSEYTRTPRFRDCVRLFIEYGLTFEDQSLLAVLADDPVLLDKQLHETPEAVNRRYSLRCAYTPLFQATLLHICAEYDHVSCAEILMKHGAEVDAIAGTDGFTFGGQTPIFHTVNQNSNNSERMLTFLLSREANVNLTVNGIIWGKGYSWETLIPAVNPISYALMGLLPQMHRNEETINGVVTRLLEKAYGIIYAPANVPNAYLKGGS